MRRALVPIVATAVAAIAGCSNDGSFNEVATAGAAPATVPAGWESTTLPPIVVQSSSTTTLMPQGVEPPSGRQAIPILVRWGTSTISMTTTFPCSAVKGECQVFPGAVAGWVQTGASFSIEPGDVDSRVDAALVNAATGKVAVAVTDADGDPELTAPAQPGAYWLAIDLRGEARTLSYAVLLELTDDAPQGSPITVPHFSG